MQIWKILTLSALVVGTGVFGLSKNMTAPESPKPVATIEPVYEEDYELPLEQAVVAPVIKKTAVSVLPSNLASLPVKKKKATFIKIMLPLIIQENAKILREYDLVTNGGNIAHLYKKYKVKAPNKAELLKRIRPIPVSLALAQAAIESGWGTSYFARKGNALFGQHAGKGEKGIPTRRPSNVRVKAYATLSGSIHDYMRNLNTHPAYKQFRSDRKSATNGLFLAKRLVDYSERKWEYVESLISVISFNNFTEFEDEQVAFNNVN